MAAKRVLGGLLAGLLLGAGLGLAQEGAVLPPPEVEVALLEDAFAQLTGFFREFILEIKGSLTSFETRVTALERMTSTLNGGLRDLEDRCAKFEGAVVPAIMSLEARVTAVEEHDFASLERRLAALDKAYEALAIRIDNNRAKIEGLETAYAAASASLDERLVVVGEVQTEAAAQREEIEGLKAGMARLTEAQQTQWTAIFLVPLAVGGLLFLLLSQGS
ncbi:MAG: hypothetical protein Kow0097_06920 [Candidatus Bipolaricaulota bacterium]